MKQKYQKLLFICLQDFYIIIILIQKNRNYLFKISSNITNLVGEEQVYY